MCESHSSVWADQIHWSEWLNIHLGCELLSSVRSDPLTWMAEHWCSLWVIPVFEQIRSTDLNGWTLIQAVGYCPVSDQIHWPEWLNIHPVGESLSSVWADHWQIYWMTEHPSSWWVAIQCLRSTDLNGWTSIQFVSRSLVFKRITGRSTDMNGWTPIQTVSPSPVFEQIIGRSTDHWPEWLDINSVCEFKLLSSVWADQIHWPECLNTHSVCESLSSVWADQIHWPGWTSFQPVRLFLMLEQITSRSTDLNGWTSFQPVSLFLMFEQIRSTDLNGGTPIQEVSSSPVFVQVRFTDQNGWTPI